MKKLIYALTDEENITPAGLLFSFLLGVLTTLLCFCVFI